jgi:hypothetical protein
MNILPKIAISGRLRGSVFVTQEARKFFESKDDGS